MKHSVLALTTTLLGTFTTVAQAACNADNCYRAFFPTGNAAQLSSASAFCSSYTKTVNTATTGFPTRVAAACGTATARYSSVCSCLGPGPTATATATATSTATPEPCPYTSFPPDGVLANGGFECPDYYPWEPQTAPGVTFKLSSPGADGTGHAWEFDVVSPVPRLARYAQARLLQRIDGLTPGKQYVLGFSTWINQYGAGFWGLPGTDGNPGGITIDAADYGGPGVWNYNEVSFTPRFQGVDVVFEVITNLVGSVFKLDNVTLTAA